METQKENASPDHKKGKNIGMAVVAYILFFVPLLTEARNDPFVKYHVKQGLVLFIAGVLCMVVAGTLFLFWLTPILNLVIIVFAVLGIINAVNGKEAPLPLIGQFAKNFKF